MLAKIIHLVQGMRNEERHTQRGDKLKVDPPYVGDASMFIFQLNHIKKIVYNFNTREQHMSLR